MRTIARTATRKIAAIAATVTGVKVYDQATGNFQPSTVDAAFTTLRDNKNARLVDMENGTYQVNVHSNYWYVLTTAPVAEDEQPAAEVTPATGTGSLAAASARTVAGVRAVRTRVAIGTQIAEACAVLGIEMRQGYAGGAAYYEVAGTSYTAGALADLVLEGGFDAAYGRAETIVRQDSPLKSAPVDPADAEAVEKLGRSKYATHRAALLTIAEKTGKFRSGIVPAGSNRFHFPVGKMLAVWGLVTVHGIPHTGFKLTEHGARVAALLAEAERAELAAEDAPRAPLTVDQAGAKVAAEYGDALAVLGRKETEEDARAKAHPYRPAVGELVVGTLKSNSTGKLIGGLQIGEFEGVDTRYGIAHLRDGHMVVAVNADSMRPAPQVPDASHLIGQKITAGLATGELEEKTGVVARIFRPSADGEYVVAQYETGWVVRIPVRFVEQTTPEPVEPKVTGIYAEKLPAPEGEERWGVRLRTDQPQMVNLTVTRPEVPQAEAEPSPYVPSEVSGGDCWYVVDSRYGLDAFDRTVRRDSGAPATWVTFEDASEAADALWAQEVTGERSSGDRV